ncbi:carnitine dehydratase [Rhodococcus sp. 05-2255-3B1]|uniref:CaiB/BaiF CoA transferase family protein n=1 Tax=unclassified Rhodococcus (in: high G+C Gram-positive bacteria) TaxID=192944 RepID=UPI000B9BE13B|nr:MULTISPECIES: CoA transferase [unclassified Rhodococcus (in: high G+C Gram-positive bacteria)]OZE11144.1 carnitine dehydratase [Rhodococcus sp. 05-2255-3C]OZE14300.1 carnitine dehydratase [Rhodococcus sp. 05-2255-3B1]OZE24872.1 carnitine dehydratase [Rhodococcus sp. 05-2255-2A2]
MTAATGPLAGLVVADFSRVLAGPYATMMLGDMGAEVIKIERPGIGDDTRSWGPPYDSAGTATYFNSVNRNKTSRFIDLQSETGVAEAREIVAGADIVIENFRAGAMDRLGLGYSTLSQRNPGLIYCSITGFGTGGGAALPGYDLVVQAVGGLMSVTGPDAEAPTKVGVAMVDIVTGLHALSGILAALHHRSNTGAGQQIHTSLMASVLSALSNQSSAYLGAGVVPVPMGNKHPSLVPYEVFETADRPLALAVGNDRQFVALVEVLGSPALAADECFSSNSARVKHRDELVDVLTSALSARTADEWYRELMARNVPAGPVNSLEEAFAFAESLGLEPRVQVPGSVADGVRNPLDFSATPVNYRLPPPAEF